jgi:hypothetical protein
MLEQKMLPSVHVCVAHIGILFARLVANLPASVWTSGSVCLDIQWQWYR